MTGRLELDESGRVVGSHGDPVDLGPVVAPVPRPPGPAARVVVPVLRRHRRGLVVAGAGALGAAVLVTSVLGRAPEPEPVVALDLSNAILAGNSIGGPEVGPDGRLSVAFAAQAPPGTRIAVTGLVGPGLGASTVDAPVVDDSGLARVSAAAPLDCTDPALVTAQPRDYGLTVRATASSGRSAEGLVPLTRTLPGGRDVTRLNLAVADWCLARASVEVLSVSATPVPGLPLADLAVQVRNTGSQPLAVATQRASGAVLDIDLSADVVVAPGGEAVLATRTALRDCTAVPSLDPLSDLPNPRGDGPGLTLRLSSAGSYTLRSVPVPGAEALGRRLGNGLCSGAPRTSAALVDVRRVATTPGSWRLRATLSVRTDGVGVRVGRERFVGPAAGAGSFLGVEADARPASAWDARPARLDGGAGIVAVDLPGGRCADLPVLSPGVLALRVVTADGGIHPVEVPLDDERLIRAAYAACAAPVSGTELRERGWPSRLRGLPGGVGA